MKLDDNTRSALHYLLLGLAVVGLPALVIALVDLKQTAITQGHDLLALRNGYLLGWPREMTLCSTSRGERMAWAFVIAAVVVVVIGLLHRPRIALVAGVIVFGWLAFSAVRRPPVLSWMVQDRLVVVRRPVIVADLTLPWGARVDHIELKPGSRITPSASSSGRTVFSLENNGARIAFASTPMDSVQAAILTGHLNYALERWRSRGEHP